MSETDGGRTVRARVSDPATVQYFPVDPRVQMCKQTILDVAREHSDMIARHTSHSLTRCRFMYGL